VITDVLINGAPSDGRIPVTDSTVLRGDGCFEVLRSYDGKLFGIDEHLDRLARSASALHIDLPLRDDLIAWVEKTAAALGNGAVRVVVSRGSAVPGHDAPSNVIVFGHTWDDELAPARLKTVVAPWHAAGVAWQLAGAKLTSYAPNMSASRTARDAGYDDAMLLTTEGVVLEGPTFSIAWVVDGVVETPGLELGILDSITRRSMVGVAGRSGIQVVEGTWNVERLVDATEVMAVSTLREVQPVIGVDDREWEPGRVTEILGKGFEELTG
jgi:branched-subunit amino acid aminotransferase/4-amino-4-deoxychorismate lyase